MYLKKLTVSNILKRREYIEMREQRGKKEREILLQ